MRSVRQRASTTEDRSIAVRDLTFHYRTTGDSAAPPVVMLHGIMGHARERHALVQSLASTNRMYVVDQRGHGRTDWAAHYSPSAMAVDVIALVEALELEHPRVIGHSMGGMAAMIAAARCRVSEDFGGAPQHCSARMTRHETAHDSAVRSTFLNAAQAQAHKRYVFLLSVIACLPGEQLMKCARRRRRAFERSGESTGINRNTKIAAPRQLLDNVSRILSSRAIESHRANACG